MPEISSIIIEKSRGVAKITLNRPDVLNSFNAEMSARFLSVLEDVATDKNVRAILLTGAGRGFCAGQDLAEFTDEIKSGAVPQLGTVVRQRYNPVILRIRETEKLFVAAVNGVAAGAGANLALACDIVFAAENASFIQSFSKVGLIPDSGGTAILPRLIGYGRAQALAYLAEKLTAKQAFDLGMIYKVVESASLLDEAAKVTEYLATQPTLGLGLTKRLFNSSINTSLCDQLKLEEVLQDEAGRSADYREGVLSFIEKRPPTFVGK